MWFCLLFKKQGFRMLTVGIKMSPCPSVLTVTPTVSVTFSSWKWHLWHSLSESNIFTSVGSSSPHQSRQLLKGLCAPSALTTTCCSQAAWFYHPRNGEESQPYRAHALFRAAAIWGVFCFFLHIHNVNKVFSHHHIYGVFFSCFFITLHHSRPALTYNKMLAEMWQLAITFRHIAVHMSLSISFKW